MQGRAALSNPLRADGGEESKTASGGVMIPAAAPYAKLAPTVLSDDFYGTLYSKVLLTTLTKDSVETVSYTHLSPSTNYAEVAQG